MRATAELQPARTPVDPIRLHKQFNVHGSCVLSKDVYYKVEYCKRAVLINASPIAMVAFCTVSLNEQ